MRTDNPVRDADNPVTDETFPSGAAAVSPLARPSRRGRRMEAVKPEGSCSVGKL